MAIYSLMEISRADNNKAVYYIFLNTLEVVSMAAVWCSSALQTSLSARLVSHIVHQRYDTAQLFLVESNSEQSLRRNPFRPWRPVFSSVTELLGDREAKQFSADEKLNTLLLLVELYIP